jgi:hypothetical protein
MKLFSYGRVGTDIGDKKKYEKRSEKSAIETFSEKFFERTGVSWDDRNSFKKLPGKYAMVELDDGHEEQEGK